MIVQFVTLFCFLFDLILYVPSTIFQLNSRVPTVREKSGKNEKSSRSEKSQGKMKKVQGQGKVREF